MSENIKTKFIIFTLLIVLFVPSVNSLYCLYNSKETIWTLQSKNFVTVSEGTIYYLTFEQYIFRPGFLFDYDSINIQKIPVSEAVYNAAVIQ